MDEQPQQTTAGAVVNLAGNVVTGLTPQFLALVLVNAVFILGLLAFLHFESVARVQTFAALMNACSAELTKERPHE